MSTSTTKAPAAGLAATKAAATGLWVIVGAGLVYGIVQTIIKASALVTG